MRNGRNGEGELTRATLETVGITRLVVSTLWVTAVIGVLAVTGGSWAAGAVACGAGLYALLAWPRGTPGRLDGGVRSVWLIAIAVGFLVPGLGGLSHLAWEVTSVLGAVDPGHSWFQLAVTLAVFGIGLGVALRWPERWPRWLFVVTFACGALAVRLAFVSLVEVEPKSDFLEMWQSAGDVREEGLGAVVGSSSFRDRVHFERTLPYLLPLRSIFGASRWAYVIANCLTTVATSLVTYVMADRLFGARAARVAFVLSLMAIEPVLASGIPSHDIPGAFLTVVALLVFVALDRAAVRRAWKTALASALGLGILLLVVDLQRNSRIFLVGAFGLFLAGTLIAEHRNRPTADDPEGETGQPRRPWRFVAARVACVLLVPVAVSAIADAGLRSSGLRMGSELLNQWRYRAIAAHTDSWGTGTYRDARDEYYAPYELSNEAWGELAWRKLLTDTARNPEARLANYLRKANRLFDLGSQMSFYMADAETVGGRPVRAGQVRSIAFVNRCVSLLFLALTLAGLVRVTLRLDTPLLAFVPALYLALLVGALLVLFQVQPRYVFQIWYIGALYAGALFHRPVEAP